jgi:polar amino acid transport system permease protein
MNFLDIIGQLSRGVAYTLMVTLTCSATGVIVGLLVAGLRRSGITWLMVLLDLFTYVFRSVPGLVVR